MAEEERKRQRGRYDLDRGIGGVCGECVFHHALAVESCWPFYAKEHIHTQSHASLPPDFINQTACRALGVTGCPFCLLMASGEERRGESRRWTSRHYCRLSQICTQKIFAFKRFISFLVVYFNPSFLFLPNIWMDLWLEERDKELKVPTWPANSPDPNTTEHPRDALEQVGSMESNQSEH